ncbi:MAG: glycosyltransferase [Chloroflexi bacterium]|nr:glycosyltransferase [Chloroflexota bacterium]
MKVGLVVPGFSAGPDDWCIPVLVDVVRVLNRYVELHILALRYPHQAGRYRLHGAQVHALGGGTARDLRRAALLARGLAALAAEHRRGRFDVLHGLWADEPGSVAITAGRLLRAPSVVSVMGGELVALPDIGYGGRLARSSRALATLLGGATAVTAGSASGVEQVRRRLGPRKGASAVHLPWGIDGGLFSAAAAPRELAGDYRILHVGSLVPVKDQAMLLQAFRRVRCSEPAAHLHVAGDGPLRPALESQAAALGLAGSATFHGPIARHDLPAFFRAADVLAVSSRHEAQLVVALEAALCGLPIAGTAVGLVADFAPRAALAVPVGDDAGLAGALLRLREPAIRCRLASAARALVQEQYLAERTVERLLELYERIRT